MLLFLALGCGNECEQACSSTTVALDQCIDQWSADWTDLGANNRQEFQARCVQEVEDLEADLEPREWQAALEDCEVVVTEVLDLSCDELRALYVD